MTVAPSWAASLDRERADAASRADDEHDVSRADPSRAHRIEGGGTGKRDGRGGLERDRRRLRRQDDIRAGGHELRPGADVQRRSGRDEGDDLVADRDVGAPVADGLDDPGEVATDDHRVVVRHRLREVSIGLVEIDPVDARGANADQHAAVGRLRIGQIDERGGLVGSGQGIGFHGGPQGRSLRTQRYSDVRRGASEHHGDPRRLWISPGPRQVRRGGRRRPRLSESAW